jgi:hypothetical protein
MKNATAVTASVVACRADDARGEALAPVVICVLAVIGCSNQ